MQAMSLTILAATPARIRGDSSRARTKGRPSHVRLTTSETAETGPCPHFASIAISSSYRSASDECVRRCGGDAECDISKPRGHWMRHQQTGGTPNAQSTETGSESASPQAHRSETPSKRGSAACWPRRGSIIRAIASAVSWVRCAAQCWAGRAQSLPSSQTPPQGVAERTGGSRMPCPEQAPQHLRPTQCRGRLPKGGGQHGAVIQSLWQVWGMF